MIFSGGQLQGIFQAALDAADPYRALLQTLHRDGDVLQAGGTQYDLTQYARVVVVGAGKAAARMAQAIESVLYERISDGLIVVKYGHALPLQFIHQTEAAHPLPDLAGVRGTQQILQLLQGLDEKTLVVCLLSGGASALLVAPAPGISLQDKQHVTEMLLKSGATINELNVLRKHLSAVKGGRLALAAAPATVLTLILSDVIGDPLEVIASGPTAADPSSFQDAWIVLEKFHLQSEIPASVRNLLKSGMAGKLAETIKPGDASLMHVNNLLVGSNAQALQAAAMYAESQGWPAHTLTSSLQGEAREAALFLARRAHETLQQMRAGERRCLLAGGETTVTVRGKGMGGRNQELALAFALEIEGSRGISLLSCGTDGTDGPTDAAGAMVDGNTALLARRLGISPEQHLADNDSWHFFSHLDEQAGTRTQLFTGATGTNVMDVQLILLEKSD